MLWSPFWGHSKIPGECYRDNLCLSWFTLGDFLCEAAEPVTVVFPPLAALGPCCGLKAHSFCSSSSPYSRAHLHGYDAQLTESSSSGGLPFFQSLSLTHGLLFHHSVVSDSLQSHGLQHARLPECPSPSPCPYSTHSEKLRAPWNYHTIIIVTMLLNKILTFVTVISLQMNLSTTI